MGGYPTETRRGRGSMDITSGRCANTPLRLFKNCKRYCTVMLGSGVGSKGWIERRGNGGIGYDRNLTVPLSH